MPIFQHDDVSGKLSRLRASTIDKEKQLQTLIERNLDEALDMHFIASEYSTTSGGRIDTLAVDANGAPVIIEYKRNKNDNIINQGLSYLRWLKAQKSEFFEMLMIKKLGDSKAKGIKIDWANPRVVCIAESYSKFDIDTVEVIPMRIELFKYCLYDGNIFSLEQIAVRENKAKSKTSTTINKSDNLTVNDHIKQISSDTKDLFETLRAKILELDANITEKATKEYMVYRLSKNFVELHIQRKQIKIYLRPIDYDDPKKMVDNVADSYNWTLNRRVYLKDSSQINYVFGLIEQSYKDVL